MHYYIVKEKSEIHDLFLKLFRDRNLFVKIFRDFADKNGIEAHNLGLTAGRLHIEATKNDLKKFGAMLCKPNDDLHPFKAHTNINRAWRKILKEQEITVLTSHFITHFIEFTGHWRWAFFEYHNAIYLNTNSEVMDKYKKLVNVIKASEYHSAKEEKQQQIDKNYGGDND